MGGGFHTDITREGEIAQNDTGNKTTPTWTMFSSSALKKLAAQILP